jgi:hypothetical protein
MDRKMSRMEKSLSLGEEREDGEVKDGKKSRAPTGRNGRKEERAPEKNAVAKRRNHVSHTTQTLFCRPQIPESPKNFLGVWETGTKCVPSHHQNTNARKDAFLFLGLVFWV